MNYNKTLVAVVTSLILITILLATCNSSKEDGLWHAIESIGITCIDGKLVDSEDAIRIICDQPSSCCEDCPTFLTIYKSDESFASGSETGAEMFETFGMADLFQVFPDKRVTMQNTFCTLGHLAIPQSEVLLYVATVSEWLNANGYLGNVPTSAP